LRAQELGDRGTIVCRLAALFFARRASVLFGACWLRMSLGIRNQNSLARFGFLARDTTVKVNHERDSQPGHSLFCGLPSLSGL
jgi:hypothetical protein